MLQAVYRTDAVSIPQSIRVERIGIQRYPPAPLKPFKYYITARFSRQMEKAKSYTYNTGTGLVIVQEMQNAKTQ